jgi:hypothetical protein
MMTSKEFRDYLKAQFPDDRIIDGAIDKDSSECIGVYTRGDRYSPPISVGGASNSSFNRLPLTILIHWSESTNACQIKANAYYSFLLGKSDFLIGGRRISSVELLDSVPLDSTRDDKNICEMLIRLNVVYDKI